MNSATLVEVPHQFLAYGEDLPLDALMPPSMEAVEAVSLFTQLAQLIAEAALYVCAFVESFGAFF